MPRCFCSCKYFNLVHILPPVHPPETTSVARSSSLLLRYVELRMLWSRRRRLRFDRGKPANLPGFLTSPGTPAWISASENFLACTPPISRYRLYVSCANYRFTRYHDHLFTLSWKSNVESRVKRHAKRSWIMLRGVVPREVLQIGFFEIVVDIDLLSFSLNYIGY